MTTTLSQAITHAKEVSARTGATLYIRKESGRYPIALRATGDTVVVISEGRITLAPYPLIVQ